MKLPAACCGELHFTMNVGVTHDGYGYRLHWGVAFLQKVLISSNYVPI